MKIGKLNLVMNQYLHIMHFSFPLDIIALFLAVAVLPSLALYDKSDDVYELTADNFDSMVLNSEHVWVVEFYAPW